MARQGDRVQLEQSNMHLIMNRAKMATGGFSCATWEETQQLINQPRAGVWKEKKWRVEYPGWKKVTAGIEKQLAMVYK